MFLKRIIDSITPKAICIDTKENNREATYLFRFSALTSNIENLSAALGLINNRDSFTLKISLTESDQTLVLSENSEAEISDFLKKVELYCGQNDNLEGTITLKVTKEIEQGKCSVYSVSQISKHWSTGTILENLKKINSLAKQCYHLECYDIPSDFKTGLFIFSTPKNDLNRTTHPEHPDKQARIKARDKSCTFYQRDVFSFIPEDFHFDSDFYNSEIRNLFGKLQLAICLTYLCDSSRFNNNGNLELHLNGYKHISYILEDSHPTSACINDYFELYQWAYHQGNTSDKVGLCRNVLSIHIEEDNLLKLRPGCMGATTSNYAIYLKENLKQYIDIKNKINEQIQKSSEKASDLVKNIGTYLKGSIFSLYSFVFSVFLIKTLAKSTPTTDIPALPIISTSTYCIFLLFTTTSILVLCYATTEMNAEIRRFKENYASLKNRYNDLITDTDLSKILQNDSQQNMDIAYLKSARKRAIILWLASVTFIFIVISTIYFKEL